ncbi:hypothetical protein BC834DRAFT_325945 [Gloeopeniophorella convolvens]|nr:hypothetical protein BC834DRAFT_325945 [Gloeopeniophorella convolvens]
MEKSPISISALIKSRKYAAPVTRPEHTGGPPFYEWCASPPRAARPNAQPFRSSEPGPTTSTAPLRSATRLRSG